MIKKVGIIIFLFGVLFLIQLFTRTVKTLENPTITPVAATVISTPEKPVTLLMVGDMIFDRGIKRSVENNFTGDFSKLFENVPELNLVDITFGNLEGPITQSNDKRGSIYSFKFEPRVADALSGAGFDVVSFSNNHVGDYGQEGFVDTLKYLFNEDILFAGAGLNKSEALTAKVINVRGKKVGFLAFTDVGPNWMEAKENYPGIVLASDPNLDQIITIEKSKVDYLIVSFHWGEEYKAVTDRQKDLAKTAVSSGADVVVGHHPHVMQETTEIDGKPVIFSLGNFIFDQTTPSQTKVGMVALVTFGLDGSISLNTFASDRDSQYRPSAIRTLKEGDIIGNQEIKKVVFSCPKSSDTRSSLRFISFPRPEPIEGYIPPDLVLIPDEYSVTKNTCITKSTYETFLTMRKDMQKQGLSLLVKYGFRSNDLQEFLVTSFSEKGRSSFVAPVGQSEHVLGTGFDFASGTSLGIFAKSPEYQFLKSNGYKYGFVQSFEGGINDPTKIPNEPWHWRYVGKNTASAIKASGLPANLFLNSY